MKGKEINGYKREIKPIIDFKNNNNEDNIQQDKSKNNRINELKKSIKKINSKEKINRKINFANSENLNCNPSKINNNIELDLNENRCDINNNEAKSYGKYGILNCSSIFNKIQEFRMWLKDILKIKVDNKDEYKYYKQFIEQYNNVRLPDLKYYDYTKYKVEKQIAEMKKKTDLKEKLVCNYNKYSFDDEGRREFEKRLLKENLIKSQLDEAYKNIDSKKIEEIKEINYQNKLMLQLYKTGNENNARNIHDKYFKKND